MRTPVPLLVTSTKLENISPHFRKSWDREERYRLQQTNAYRVEAVLRRAINLNWTPVVFGKFRALVNVTEVTAIDMATRRDVKQVRALQPKHVVALRKDPITAVRGIAIYHSVRRERILQTIIPTKIGSSTIDNQFEYSSSFMMIT